MIARYTRPHMAHLWSDQNRFKTWLEVELAVLSVLGQERIIPKNVAYKIRKKAKINVSRILEIEKEVHHDVIAFCTSITEQVKSVGRFFHYGLTSSDVVDTALMLLLRETITLIREGLINLDQVLQKLALQYRDLPCIGRTHGIHAEPTSFGLKFLGWLAENRRQIQRLDQMAVEMQYGKLSGAVGCYGVLSPAIEKKALALLGLKPEWVSTQILPRDRHAEFFCVLAEIGSSIERIAVELRHLQRTEVGEIEEGFKKTQKGSSAMPHKKNPISAENLSGCARLLRGYALSALENVALWHERDISHSSVERVIAPDATTLLDYMIHRLIELLTYLCVNEDRVRKNLNLTQGVYFSGRVLLKLVEKGMSREEAYRMVQRCAHLALEKELPFCNELWNEPTVREKFSQSELQSLFNVKNYLKHVDAIYDRVLRTVVPQHAYKPKKIYKR